MKNGIVIIDKPQGMTSHDVVNKLRRIYKTKKVGHTGTLDPDATGVLPICVGQATRLAEYFNTDDKHYRTTLRFGTETETQDASGEVVATFPLPSLDEAAFIDVLKQFVGPLQQQPTMYSAIKYQGEPLYYYARQGITIPDLPPRNVTIYALHCLHFSKESAEFEVHCSKGTYIRTLCRDIAKACDSGGHMATLRRLASGSFVAAQAVSIATLETAADPYAYMINMSTALSHLPTIDVAGEQHRLSLQNGRAIAVDETVPTLSETDWVKALYRNQLLAIGRCESGRFQPKKVFQIEDEQ